MVKTKIICTLGPSSSDVTVLRKMMLAGMDVVRLNFSHANHSQHQSRMDLIRRLNKQYRRHVRVLQDLEGYRIRIGKFKDKKAIELKKRQAIFLTNKDSLSAEGMIHCDYQGSMADIKKNSFIYIDDGNIALKVKQRNKNYLKAEVIFGGLLRENKGINIPGLSLGFKGLTEKDKIDLEFGIRQNVDFIAQSFVRSRQDILSLRKYLKDRHFHCRLIAKIENRQGMRNLDEILESCDGVMVARGDLGVSLPIYQIPVFQKMIIKKCRQRKKLAITATQMLESMTENYRPTRAEVSDVANAIIDGSDYLMLSAETAVGRYPVAAVKMMNDIIKFTESPSLDFK